MRFRAVKMVPPEREAANVVRSRRFSLFRTLVAFLLVLLTACGAGALETPSLVAPAPTARSLSTVPPHSVLPIPPTARPTFDPLSRYNTPGGFSDAIESGGRERTFKVHLPSQYRPGARLPLLLAFHGGLSTAEEMERRSGLSALADESGFIVVYPQAYSHRPGVPARWQTALGEDADVLFVRDLIDHLSTHLSIDPHRIYAAGYSNGATFVDTLSCQLADRLAAVASVAGGYADPLSACAPARPLSVLYICGTSDGGTPYDGPSWIPLWAQRYDCALEVAVERESGGVTRRMWEDCDQQVVVATYTVDGGGHAWFHEPLDSSAVLWSFFASRWGQQ